MVENKCSKIWGLNYGIVLRVLVWEGKWEFTNELIIMANLLDSA